MKLTPEYTGSVALRLAARMYMVRFPFPLEEPDCPESTSIHSSSLMSVPFLRCCEVESVTLLPTTEVTVPPKDWVSFAWSTRFGGFAFGSLEFHVKLKSP